MVWGSWRDVQKFENTEVSPNGVSQPLYAGPALVSNGSPLNAAAVIAKLHLSLLFNTQSISLRDAIGDQWIYCKELDSIEPRSLLLNIQAGALKHGSVSTNSDVDRTAKTCRRHITEVLDTYSWSRYLAQRRDTTSCFAYSKTSIQGFL